MKASVWIHGALAAAGLLFAWMRHDYVAEKVGAVSAMTLLEASAGDVVKLNYRWDKGESTVTSTGSLDDRLVQLTIDREVPPKDDKKKDSKDSDDGALSVVAPPTREMGSARGGKAVVDALDALEPLRSRRTLGEVPTGQLEAMGLTNPTRRLTVETSKGRKLELVVGDAAYGTQGRYTMVAGQPQVHLVDGGLVTGLEGGLDALAEKRLVTLPIERIAGLVLRRAGSSKEFAHLDADQTSLRRLEPRKEGRPTGEKSAAAGKALTSLRNLKGGRVITDAAVATSAPVAMVAEVESASGKRFIIEVLQRPDGGYWASSGGQLVELAETPAKELLGDVDAALE